MLVKRVDPETGEVLFVDDGQGDVPQALAPAEVQGPQPQKRIPFGAPTQQLDSVRREDAQANPSLSLPPLEGMPPVRPVEDMASASQAGKGPGFIERIGGPKPETLQGRGFMDTLGQFATSDLGRSVIGALGVGLAGIRNPRDGGALQQQLMQMHFQGTRERGERARQGDAMGGLYEGLNNAHMALAKGDLDGASKILAPLAKNPAIRQNPEAMKALLTMQNRLTNSAGERHSMKLLSEGPEPQNFRDFMEKASATGMSLENIIKMGPSMIRDTKAQLIHSDKLGVIEYKDGKVRQLVKPPEGETGTPVKYSDLDGDAKKGIDWLMENHPGVNPKDFLAELNHPDKARRDVATQALGVGMAQVRARTAREEKSKRDEVSETRLEEHRRDAERKAREAAEKDANLTWSDKPTEGALWFNKETRRNVLATEPESRMRESMKSGKYMRFGSAAQTEMISAAESAFGAIDKLHALAKRNPKALAWGSAGGATGGVASFMSADVAEAQSLIGLGLSNIVRLQGERGNLSEGDITRAKDAIAGLSSGKGYQRKLETVLELINKPLTAKGFAPLKFTAPSLKDDEEKPSTVRGTNIVIPKGY